MKCSHTAGAARECTFGVRHFVVLSGSREGVGTYVEGGVCERG